MPSKIEKLIAGWRNFAELVDDGIGVPDYIDAPEIQIHEPEPESHSIEIAELHARLDEARTVYVDRQERIDELCARLAELEKKAEEKP